MTKINGFFVILLSVVLLSSCNNTSQGAPDNTLNNQPAQNISTPEKEDDTVKSTAVETSTPELENTPADQPVQDISTPEKEDDTVKSAIVETPTLELDNSHSEQEENGEDNITQISDQVSEQISDNAGSYFLIQFSATLGNELRQQLLEAGVILYDPLGNNVYQAYIPANALPFLEELLKRNEIISITTIPHQGKIKSPLNDPDQVNSSQSYQITVQFFDVPTTTEKETLEKIMIIDEYAEGVMNFAQGHTSGNDLGSIAELPFVKLIEEVVQASGGGGNQ